MLLGDQSKRLRATKEAIQALMHTSTSLIQLTLNKQSRQLLLFDEICRANEKEISAKNSNTAVVGFLCCAATKQRQHDTQQRSLVYSKRAYYNQNLHYVTNVQNCLMRYKWSNGPERCMEVES